MTTSNGPDNKPLVDAKNLTEASTDAVEGLLEVATAEPLNAQGSNRLSDLESVDLMIDDQDELVDLDALFDALNVAANEGVDAISYIDDQAHGGVLTVTNEAFAALDLDDMGVAADELTSDKMLSDES